MPTMRCFEMPSRPFRNPPPWCVRTGPAAQQVMPCMLCQPTDEGHAWMQETVGLCFACFRASVVEGSQEIVCAGLPHDHLRLQVARQRLTNSVVAWLNQGAAPLPPHASAFAAMLLEELQHLGKEELLAVSSRQACVVLHAVLDAAKCCSPCVTCTGGACCPERV